MDEWPEFRGPTGQGHAAQGRLPVEWSATHHVAWKQPVPGTGWSSPVVSQGQVFLTTGITGGASGGPSLRALCFDAASGRLLWKHEYDRPYHFSFAGGPRTTPTVDGDRVYALGAEGNLWCLDAADGRVVWSKDFAEDYGAPTPFWGHSAHPLVDGDTVYCVVGGKGSIAVAFDKHSGRERWRALSASEQGYCPPAMIEHGGTKQLLIFHAEALASLDPATGKVYWSVPIKPAFGMAIAAPRKLGSHLFASAYGDVAVLLKLDDEKPGAEVVWGGGPNRAVYSANVTPFLEDGMIYGCDANSGALMGVRLQDGERLWQTVVPTLGPDGRGRYGTAFLVKHGDRFFLFNEWGQLILARLSAEGYEELDRTQVIEPTNRVFGRPLVWSHPAFAERSIFARNDKELIRVSLAAEE
jgi:outer membrane protein assembly factor BamB